MAKAELSLQPCTLQSWAGSWFNWLKWNSFEDKLLVAAEKKILSLIKKSYRGHYVGINNVVDASDRIWTISLNEESKKTPLVLLHGLASGSALWCLNLDSLAAQRPVHALDVLGFAKSSRPTFSTDDHEAEKQLVDSVEAWRKEMKIDQMILLGHSMGGFIAASYAINYPDRVKHLVLADPWGLPPKPDEPRAGRKIPIWAKPLVFIAQKFYPLSALRATGPFGQWMVEKLRPDLIKHFESFMGDDIGMIPQYIHQCNVQEPSGEMAFTAMTSAFGWAKNPMIHRIGTLRFDVPLTVLYGARSWVDISSGEVIKENRPQNSFVNVVIIQGAGHHLYAERSDMFNKHVNEACGVADDTEDL